MMKTKTKESLDTAIDQSTAKDAVTPEQEARTAFDDANKSRRYMNLGGLTEKLNCLSKKQPERRRRVMEALTSEQLNKLPKWAQQHVADLQHELHSVRVLLKQHTDEQTPSPFYTEGFDSNMKEKVRRYIEAPMDTVYIENAGIRLAVYVTRPDDSQRPHGIELSYDSADHAHKGNEKIALHPGSPNRVFLINHVH